MVGAPVDLNVLIEFEDLGRSISFDLQAWNESILIKEVHCYDETVDPETAYNGYASSQQPCNVLHLNRRPVFEELDLELQNSFYGGSLDYHGCQHLTVLLFQHIFRPG